MRHAGRGATQGFEDLDLRAGIGDMVLTANHVGDPSFNIIDTAGQRVEIRAIGADQNRIRQATRLDRLFAAHQIVPDHAVSGQLEPPMRLAALGFIGGLFSIGQIQSCAIIDGWIAPRALQLALTVKLIGRFITRIEQAHFAQLIGGGIIFAEPL